MIHIRQHRSVLLAAWSACVAAGLVAAVATAHPLGNTSVNIYERVELGGSEIRVRFVMDVAEFPALDEQRFADTNDDGTVDQQESDAYLDGFWTYLQPRLQLVVASRPLPLERTSESLTFPPGQGGLTLMRVVFELVAPQPAAAAGTVVSGSLAETTFEGVPGWHEIVVRSAPGAIMIGSDVPEDDLTNELTFYPEERLTDPLSIRAAAFQYRLEQGQMPSTEPTNGAPASPGDPSVAPRPERPQDPLVALLGPQTSLAAAVLAIVVSIGLGAAHALSPGHGKTLVAAYLVGTRSDVSRALWLGLTVAATHTVGVFILGAVTFVAAEWVVPDRLVSWLSVATGLLVLLLGAILLARSRRILRALNPRDDDDGARGVAALHDHSHPHGAADEHRHAEVAPDLRRRDVAALGIVGGLVPSGSALLLLLSSVAMDQIALGLVLILAFGLGMALVLVGIATGVVLLRDRSPWDRWRGARLARLVRFVPSVSGLAVIVLGLVLTAEALRNLR